jgi:hypothetical protein
MLTFNLARQCDPVIFPIHIVLVLTIHSEVDYILRGSITKLYTVQSLRCGGSCANSCNHAGICISGVPDDAVKLKGEEMPE